MAFPPRGGQGKQLRHRELQVKETGLYAHSRAASSLAVGAWGDLAGITFAASEIEQNQGVKPTTVKANQLKKKQSPGNLFGFWRLNTIELICLAAHSSKLASLSILPPIHPTTLCDKRGVSDCFTGLRVATLTHR